MRFPVKALGVIAGLIALQSFAQVSSPKFANYPQCRRLIEAAAQYMQDFHSPAGGTITWGVDYDRARKPRVSYNTFFSSVMPTTLEDWARARRKLNLRTDALDFMGSARFSEEPGLFTQLIGLRYERTVNDWPDSEQREIIESDVFSVQLWPKVDRVLERRKISVFDLIVVRGLGATQSIHAMPERCATHSSCSWTTPLTNFMRA